MKNVREITFSRTRTPIKIIRKGIVIGKITRGTGSKPFHLHLVGIYWKYPVKGKLRPTKRGGHLCATFYRLMDAKVAAKFFIKHYDKHFDI